MFTIYYIGEQAKNQESFVNTSGLFYDPFDCGSHVSRVENVFRKIVKKVLTKSAWMWYTLSTLFGGDRAPAGVEKTFQKKMKKGVDKGGGRWYNIQAVREGGTKLLEN